MSGQQLRQIPASALLAEQLILFSYNKKFIYLTTLLTTVFVNWHIFSFHVLQIPILPEKMPVP